MRHAVLVGSVTLSRTTGLIGIHRKGNKGERKKFKLGLAHMYI